MQIICEATRQRDEERLGQKKMRRCYENTIRQMREMRRNKGRQEERHYSNDLKGFVCMAVM